MLRVPDNFDHPVFLNRFERHGEIEAKLVPASFLHGSMRAPNPIFYSVEPPIMWPAALVVGSRLRTNQAILSQRWPDFPFHSIDPSSIVNESVCYPGDAGTGKRQGIHGEKSVLHSDHGRGCRSGDVCMTIDDNDMSTQTTNSRKVCLADSQCQCLTTKDNTMTHSSKISNSTSSYEFHNVPFADFMTKLAGTKQQKQTKNKQKNVGLKRTTTYFSCWFDFTRCSDFVNAANSLWMQRYKWTRHSEPNDYKGWTECPVSKNIRNVPSLDAIALYTPPAARRSLETTNSSRNSSWEGKGRSRLMEEKARAVSTSAGFATHVVQPYQERLTATLHELYRRGYGDLPVMFMLQLKGMTDQGLCDEFWDGVDCDDGYQKVFVALRFLFHDGSCLEQAKTMTKTATTTKRSNHISEGTQPTAYFFDSISNDDYCSNVFFFPNCANKTMPTPCRGILSPATKAATDEASAFKNFAHELYLKKVDTELQRLVDLCLIACALILWMWKAKSNRR